MKQTVVTSYVFNASAQTLDLGTIVGFNIERLYAVINLTASQVIYAAGIPAYGYSNLTGTVLTLTYNTTAMSNTDKLEIIYDTVNTDLANAWVTKLTDGTNVQGYTALGEAKVDITQPLPVGTNNIGNITNITGTVVLPTNAAQETGGHLASLDSKFGSLGQKASAGSAPVVIASDQSALPVSQSGSWTVSLSTEGIEIGKVDQGLPATATNGWPVKPTDGTNSQGFTALGEGKVITTNDSVIKAQLQDNAGTGITLGQKVSASSLPMVIASDQSPVPVSQSGTWNITNISGTVSLPTGAATSLNQTNGSQQTQLVDDSGHLGTIKPASTASIATDTSLVTALSPNSPLPAGSNVLGGVTQSGTWTVQQGTPPWSVSQSGAWTTGRTWTLASGSDSVAAVQSGTWNITNISGTITLPTNAAQESGGHLASLDSKFGSLGQKAMAGSAPVVIASDQSAIPVSQNGAWTTGRTWTLASGSDSVSAVQSGTWNITNISGTVSLPTNAAQETGGHLASLDAKFSSSGQKTSASSAPVVLASDQSAIPVSQSGSWTVSLATESIEIGKVDQGTAGSNAQAWWTKLGDGTNGPVAVKPASTAAIATDPSLVVALSPNSPLPTGANVIGSVSQNGTWTVQQGGAPWSVSQSGAWTTGRTWTLASGTDSVSAVQSGSWTVQQGGAPWSQNVTQFGGTNISTGTGASGAGIPRVTVANDSNILATQSGTWTVQQGTPPWTQNLTQIADSAVSTAATGVLKVGIVGNAGAAFDAVQGATAPANVLAAGGVHNTALPTIGNGDISALQLDANGRLITSSEGATGSAVPTNATQVGGSDGTNTQAVGVQTAASQPPSGGYYLQVVPMAYSFKNLSGAATTTVKSGAGILHEFNINNNDVSATATIYDNTAASGTIIATITNTLGGGASIQVSSILHDIAFTTGLTIVVTGATANYTAVYK